MFLEIKDSIDAKRPESFSGTLIYIILKLYFSRLAS